MPSKDRYQFADPEWGTDNPATVWADKPSSNEEYLDPEVYRTIPGTSLKAALPRRINPDYRKYPSPIKRFFNWLTRKEEEPRACNYKSCRKDIYYRTKYILITPDTNVHYYCSLKCLHGVWGHDCEWESTPEEVQKAIEYFKNR